MSRSFVRTAAAVAGTTFAVTSAFAATAVAAPSSDGTIPTFTEIVDSTFQDLDRGFVVNGDEPATTMGDCASSTTAWSPSPTPSRRAPSSTR